MTNDGICCVDLNLAECVAVFIKKFLKREGLTQRRKGAKKRARGGAQMGAIRGRGQDPGVSLRAQATFREPTCEDLMDFGNHRIFLDTRNSGFKLRTGRSVFPISRGHANVPPSHRRPSRTLKSAMLRMALLRW